MVLLLNLDKLDGSWITSKTSSLPWLKNVKFLPDSLFTSGINHEYANVLDSRQITHMPMVNGMLACIITASISSVNYEGKVLPDLLSLGSTSELQVSPAVSTGSVYDVSIYGMSNIVKSIWWCSTIQWCRLDFWLARIWSCFSTRRFWIWFTFEKTQSLINFLSTVSPHTLKITMPKPQSTVSVLQNSLKREQQPMVLCKSSSKAKANTLTYTFAIKS